MEILLALIAYASNYGIPADVAEEKYNNYCYETIFVNHTQDERDIELCNYYLNGND